MITLEFVLFLSPKYYYIQIKHLNPYNIEIECYKIIITTAENIFD